MADVAKNVVLAEISAAIAGEVDASHRERAQYATDASNYRVVPLGVVYPKTEADVAQILRICRRHGVPFTARGGGTSVAGNSIGSGIVADFSRYLNNFEIDAAARTATVQPGVVMSDLQAAAAQYGLRFGPDPSTQNRATFGGMIGNNACGPHAVAYGRTADNVLELRGIDGHGREFTAATASEVAGGLLPHPENSAEIYRSVAQLVDEHLADIRQNLGHFSRQVSGYSLEHMLPEAGRDLAKMLVGSEGTLAVITSAKLRLVPIAQAPSLIALGYPDMPTAADAVPAILRHKPLAVEGIDAELVAVVRRAKGQVPELPAGAGWLLVEVGAHEGEPLDVVPQRIADIVAAANTEAVKVLPAGPAATEIWRIRADGAGLGGHTPAGNPAWPGWEDSAVPPENLGPYLRQLQELMGKFGLHGLMYGHFGDGCMHVRIDFPFNRPNGPAIFRDFLEQAAELAISHGGSLSGEHGDGRARSELLTRMYPPEIISLFQAVKELFDPDQLLNPGVLVEPEPLDANLRRPQAQPIGYAGGFHFHEDGGDFTRAVHRCTGVGNCRADRTAAGFFMCPSYQATKSEKDVTRGRARVLQEIANGTLVSGFADSAVQEALELCLSCKACAADCPMGVNIAKYKSETLFRGYQGKLRPRTHYVLGNLPVLARLVGTLHLGSVANAVLKIAPLRQLAFRLAGIDPRRQMPGFASRRFSKIAGQLRASGVPAAADKRYVMLWADSFSETLDTRGAQAMVAVLQRCGYTVLIPPEQACCGLTWISTGQLDIAKKKLQQLLEVLAPFAASGIPIVGVEPSCTAVLRDDLLDLLPEDNRSQVVSAATYTLAELLTAPEPIGPGDRLELPNLTGLEVVAQPHCHQYSVMGWQAEEKLLARTGAQLTRVSGCCGLAGNFGMEAGHYEVSVRVAENDLLPKLKAAPADAVYLADGFSCRTQAEQLAGDTGVHLAELLRDGFTVQRKGKV
ncbi:MAG: FAD-binding and (Fe-S)-binding domain-containing protein [Trueperella sp.]|nr:FAD-binding and (Fe-S)-binding domain-containing protein [Trueperella sp.]